MTRAELYLGFLVAMLDIISIGLIALIALIAFREISKWLLAVFY